LETVLSLPISEGRIWENMLDFRLLDLIAELIVACEPPLKGGPGHPRSELVRVVATLRRFLREGLPWRSLRATIEQVSGSTLRRFLAFWAENAVLAKVHALLVAMLRGNPTLILDSCSVRAKRGGDLVGPNPTDRAKMGSKYHIAINGDGVPVACRVSAANVPDTLLFERLFMAALGVMARIRNVYADKGYDAERHRQLCRACKVKPFIHKRGRQHGSGLGRYRWPVERTLSWLLENKRLGLRYDRCGFIIQSLLQAGCIFLVAPRLAREL
jgi:transposase